MRLQWYRMRHANTPHTLKYVGCITSRRCPCSWVRWRTVLGRFDSTYWTPCCASCLAATRERLSLFHDLVAAHRIGHPQGRVPDLPKNREAMNRLCNIWLFKRHNSGGAETCDDSTDGTMVISPLWKPEFIAHSPSSLTDSVTKESIDNRSVPTTPE